MSIHELQAALLALDEAADGHTANAAEVYATARVIEAARRVAEGAGEPVAWQYRYAAKDGYFSGWFECAGKEVMRESVDYMRANGRVVEARALYTTPPSADALVEALEELCDTLGDCGMTANARAALAKHKENTDGR